MRTLEVDVELAKHGHTRESLFALLDLLLPPSAVPRPHNVYTYVMEHNGGRVEISGLTRFTIEDCIRAHFDIPISMAEYLGTGYAVARGYALWVRQNNAAIPKAHLLEKHYGT